MKRRSFLLGLAGASLLSPLAYLFEPKEIENILLGNTSSGGPLQRVKQTTHGLGADVSITVVHHDVSEAKRVIAAALRELELVESVMSLYRPDSELSRLNRDRSLQHPHPYLVHVLKRALELSAQSGGAFDVTVQPLWELYQRHAQQGTIPAPKEIEHVRNSVGWNLLRVSERTIRIVGAETAVTLNGIAQGFATDMVRRSLQANGVVAALIDTGELGSIGKKESGECWRIGIKHPREQGRLLGLAELSGRCLSTSGDYETRFSQDYRLHHIVDPRTGISPAELASVTVLASSGLEADALSTAMMVMGVSQAIEFARAREDIEALLVTKAGKRIATEGFPRLEAV